MKHLAPERNPFRLNRNFSSKYSFGRMIFSEKSATFREFAAPVAANLSGIAAGSYCCREDDFDQ
jgi:hypothetical protein